MAPQTNCCGVTAAPKGPGGFFDDKFPGFDTVAESMKQNGAATGCPGYNLFPPTFRGGSEFSEGGGTPVLDFWWSVQSTEGISGE